PIERIEGLGNQLQFCMLGDGKGFAHARVEGDDAWQPEGIASNANALVGVVSIAVQVAAHPCREWLAALSSEDAGEFPSTEDRTRNWAQALGVIVQLPHAA